MGPEGEGHIRREDLYENQPDGNEALYDTKPAGQMLEKELNINENVRRLELENENLKKIVEALTKRLDVFESIYKEDRATLVGQGLIATSEIDEEGREHLRKIGYPGVEAPSKDI